MPSFSSSYSFTNRLYKALHTFIACNACLWSVTIITWATTTSISTTMTAGALLLTAPRLALAVNAPLTVTSMTSSSPSSSSSLPTTTATTSRRLDGSNYVLVTGGAGYIGSHTTLELLNAGEKVVVIDNLCNAVEESLHRVRKLSGCPKDSLIFRKVDLCEKDSLKRVFEEFNGFESCIHFAGLKAVGESVAKPLLYYRNNVEGTLNLLECMKEYNCYKLVFSSSATVYGIPQHLPLVEDSPVGVGITNPYGRTKYMIEEILRDEHMSCAEWNILLLRYFNPIGAHSSGQIGEDPDGIPNNLMPFVAQVAVGRRPHVSVFGADYKTPDGTGVRDYIHVVDLAEGHVAALRKLRENQPAGCRPVNLGTGIGYSVLDVIKSMEKACGHEVAYQVAPRRVGDVAAIYANPDYARKHLGWVAKRNMEEMCADTWRWQSQNPKGYNKAPSEVQTAEVVGANK